MMLDRVFSCVFLGENVMKLIKTSLIIAFLFVPLVGAHSFTVTNCEYMTVGLPAKPLPGQETGGTGDSETGPSEEAGEYNSRGDEEFNDSGTKDSEDFEDWYEPDPAYQ